MKKISITMALITLLSGQTHAINMSAADMGSPGVSVMSVFASGMIVLSPIFAPIMVSHDRITDQKEAKAREKAANHKAQTIPKDAVPIEALDKDGQPCVIYMPQEAAQKVTIAKTDRIELITQNNGTAMKKNGNVEYFFMLPEDVEQKFYQTQIETH